MPPFPLRPSPCLSPETAASAAADPAALHRDLANAIRALAMDAVERAKSGHPGMPMGMADVATVLFRNYLKFDAAQPEWPDRDRLVLSAGHGSMLLYALLYLAGYPEMTVEELKRFRQLGSRTAGHPEFGHAPGIETTTGPLGQGLANAVGMALAERHLNAAFGDELVDHRTWCIAGDGCLMEGISHEAISLAGHLKLSRLIVLFDDNHISIDGPTDLTVSDDQLARFAASGWATLACDGHDPTAIAAALDEALQQDRPTLVACRTTIGYGAPTLAGTAKTHGAPLGEKEIAGTREKLGWSHAPFEVPPALLQTWRAIGRRGASSVDAWEKRLAGSNQRAEFERRIAGRLPAGWQDSLKPLKDAVLKEKPAQATRISSQRVLDALVPALPELLGGSADLTGSNNTKAAAAAVLSAKNYGGRYVHYGVREHAMAAAMNGLALHRGVIPFGGTFLVFTDYCRPAIRLSALMQQRVVYVMTHDSIGLGEDGPTHQPVEHLAALRAMPNLLVLRPCDAIETAEAWEIALQQESRPSVIALTRQNVPTVRGEAAENLSAFGGYILAPASRPRAVTLLASGSEVAIALAAQKQLEGEGIAATVVSLVSWELFGEQPQHYRDEVLGPGTLRIGIEAAGGFGWERWLGTDGAFVGMRSFGASAPAPELYQHFGVTPEAVVRAVKARL
jgi:transketolase